MYQEQINPLTLKAERHRIASIRSALTLTKSKISEDIVDNIEQKDITFESIFNIYITYVDKRKIYGKKMNFKDIDDKEYVALAIMNDGEYPTLVNEILAHRYDSKIYPSEKNIEAIENAIKDFCARFGIEIDAMVYGLNMSFKRPLANTAGEMKSVIKAYGFVGRNGFITSKKQYKQAIDGTLTAIHVLGKPLPLTDVNKDIVDKAMQLYFIDCNAPKRQC